MKNKKLEPGQRTTYKHFPRRRILIASIIFTMVAVAAVAGFLAYQHYQRYKVTTQASSETTKFADIKFDTTVEWDGEYQRIIPDLIKLGYTLVTVSDLLDLDPAHPTVNVYSHR